MEDFTDKVVAILGAASPIGTAAAILYTKRGATLILCDSDENELNDVVAQCHAEGAKSEQLCLVNGDVSDGEIQENILKIAEEKFKRLDVLVNAAETKIPGSPVPGIDMNDFKTTLDKNLQSVANICFAAVRLLKESKGNIVNVSSSLGNKPTKNYVSYCVSKAGLDMLTKCLALDLAPHGIRVNSVNPAVAVSDETDSDSSEFMKIMASKTPMGRLATAYEIAEAILFFSSDRSSFTTGQLLCIDGGAGLSHA